MTTIITRSGKGAALTHTEVDANFTNLNADKAEASAVILATQKGAASGVCPLDATSKVASTYLPSYVDDVLEYANFAALPVTGETGKIYVALDTNKTYRWSGSAYIYITSGAVDSVAGKTGVVTLTAADVGLGNVTNTSDANKPVSTATQTALDLKAPLASPTFTGTVSGITAAMVGLGNVTNNAAVANLSGTNTGDQTLPTTLPASDVYAWAKNATKPTYTYTEVGAQPAGTYATGTGSASGVNTGDQTNISGNAAGLSVTLAVASGGTGLTAVGTSGNVLTSNGTAWVSSSAPTATVVSAAFTMSSTVATGSSLVLGLSGTSALVGGSVASFEVTDWNAAVTTTTATTNAASKTLTASTTIGQVLSVSVIAIDNFGNRSLPVVHTSTVILVSINAVTITSPANAATGIAATPTISGNSFGVTGGTDTHFSADWEIWTGANRTGTLVWSSINDTVNKTSITVPASTLVVNTTYSIAARYKGTTYGYGNYGYCSFTTATSFVPTVAGTAYQGGFYAGKIVIGGSTYALVVAPKSTGENTARQWKTTSDTTAGTLSLNDGLSNSNAMNNASHPAAQFCRALTIGGYSDWYLPSRDELEIVYRNCKPNSTANNVYLRDVASFGVSGNGLDNMGVGYNANSLPVGVAYTTSNPTTSVALAYTTGNAEVFSAAYYWSSTEFSATYAWEQYFYTGYQDNYGKTNDNYVRAVRKVLI